MSDSFLFSVQNEFGVKEPFAGRGLVNCPTRQRLDWCVAHQGCLLLQVGPLFRHLLPLLVPRWGNERWAGHVLSPLVTWAGINMFVLLKNNKTVPYSSPQWFSAFTSHQHRECSLSSMSSPPFSFVDWRWPFKQLQCSLTAVLFARL